MNQAQRHMLPLFQGQFLLPQAFAQQRLDLTAPRLIQPDDGMESGLGPVLQLPRRAGVAQRFLETYVVDSKFDEAVATPPYEVVTDPFVS